jgi:hypothetical protein
MAFHLPEAGSDMFLRNVRNYTKTARSHNLKTPQSTDNFVPVTSLLEAVPLKRNTVIYYTQNKCDLRFIILLFSYTVCMYDSHLISA